MCVCTHVLVHVEGYTCSTSVVMRQTLDAPPFYHPKGVIFPTEIYNMQIYLCSLLTLFFKFRANKCAFGGESGTCEGSRACAVATPQLGGENTPHQDLIHRIILVAWPVQPL